MNAAFLASALSESDGSPSSMRIAMTLCVLTACFLAIWPTVHDKAVDVQLVMAFLGIGFGAKVWQKGKETAKADSSAKQ